MHGYQLRERLGDGLGALWRIASSQLYQVLHRLENANWVTKTTESGGAGPSRHVYAVTDAGGEAFWIWATSPVRHVRQMRVEFFAKIYLLRRLAPERLSDLVAEQLRILRELRDHLHARAQIDIDDSALATLAASYRRCQVEAVLRWLEDHVEQLSHKEETP